MMIERMMSWLFLFFWIGMTIIVVLSRETFELFQWIVLLLISAIGLMLANYFFDKIEEKKR